MRPVTKRLRWIGAGAALTWFFDPVRGDERRARTRAIATDLLRGARRLAGGAAERLPAVVRRRAERLVDHLPSFDTGTDRILAAQIRDEVLERAGAPQLLVEVRSGRVVVRGVLADIRDVAGIEDQIRRIPHVVSVDLRLHTPSETAAPMAHSDADRSGDG